MKPVSFWPRFFLVLLAAAIASTATAQSGNADLALSFNNNSALSASTGQYFKCSINLYNGGWETATNSTITNWLPAGLEFVSATSSRGTCSESAGIVTCALGDLPPYQSATLTMEFKAIATGSFTNVAIAASATPDPNSTNSEASFTTVITDARFFGVGSTHVAYYGTPLMTLMTNNQVLVAGEHLGKTMDLYNMSSRTFTLPIGTAVGVHKNGSATLLANGLVLLAGGGNSTGAKTAELYNPATQLFRQVGDMLVYSYGHYATLQPDGTVVLCGGALTTNQLFNPVTETFSLAPTKQCAFNGIHLPTGKFLYFGYGRAYLYDTNTSTSVETSGFIQPRAYHTATLLQNGKVLMAGGSGTWGTTTGPLFSAELYDPITDTFTRTANLTATRLHHSACLLPDGTVLLAGGMVSDNDPFSLTNAEVYDLNGAVNVPGVGVSDTTVAEGDSGTNWMQFTLWLTKTSSLPVTVNFATAGGTAGTVDWGVANVDFANTNGTVTFSPGQTSAIVLVPIIGDFVREPDETLTLSLKFPTQAWMARSSAVGTILDNDPIPNLTIAPATATEHDTGMRNLIFNATLSAQSLTTVTVDYFSRDVTAQAGSDYLTATGTVTFAPGDTLKTIQVPVIGDLDPEPDETLQLILTNAQNAVITVAQATGTIVNDDGFAGRIHHFDIDPIGALQTQTIPFPVTIRAKDAFGNPATNPPALVQLSVQTTNVIAANLDFEQPSLAPWTTFDNTPHNKSFQQTVYDVAGLGQFSTAFRVIAGGGTNSLTQNIFLSGGFTYTFKVNVAQSMEGYDMSCLGAAIYLHVGTTNVGWGTSSICHGPGIARNTLSLVYTPPTNGFYPLEIRVVRNHYFGDALAVYADDVQISYPVITPTLLTNAFTNGVWSGSVATLQSATNATLTANDFNGHKGFSNPFDIQPAVDLGLAASSQIQGTPPLRTGMNLQFNLAITNRGPSAAMGTVVEYTLPPNLAFLSATNLLGSISNIDGVVTWTLDSLAKSSNATAVLVCRADIPGDFTNVFNASASWLDLNLADNSVALSNHVDPPLLFIGNASGTEAFASATGMVFAATLSGPSAQTITVDYFTVNGTATSGIDYIGTNGTVVFAPGATNANIVVYAIDDILDEPDRSFTVLLTNAVNAIISDGSGEGIVLDDDPPPTITIADTSVVEGDSGTTDAVFQLTLSKPAIFDVSVRCTTATNTASANDYTHTVATVLFPVGSTNATFSVPVLGNTVNESDETFFVNLTLPSNATIANAQAVGTILNDDAVPGRLDHFAWDAVPSPRYNAWPFPVTLRALDYLGNPATNGVDSATVTARTENGMLERLRDDFEDGDSIGWTNFNSSLTALVTNETAAQGLKSLRLTGSAANTFAGLRRAISNSQPNKITFAVRADRTNQNAGRLVAIRSSSAISAQFFFNNKGQMGLQDRQLGFRGVPYESNRWYQVELTLDWPAQKIDCRIDGALAITNVTFLHSGATSMDFVYLANTENATSWWDNIQVFHDNITNVFTISPSNFTAFATGVKSNFVTISGSGSNVFLTADDGLEHVGKSGFFDLLPVNLKLQTPASVNEGTSPIAAQVTLSAAPPHPILVNLTSSVPAKLTVPATATVQANQTNANFNLNIVDDTNADWVTPVSLSASGINLVSATNVISVIDNDPTLALAEYGLLADGRFQLGLQGPPARDFELSASSNLIDWDAILTFSFTNAPLTFIDDASTNLDRRFYRLAPVAP
ncbi:MAG: DUF11 domain-containing protein [Verrucomicrobia bacterium]|nr:DUF11 domain-containing protein [Verrucomicrobiota bacterium]